MFKDYVALLKVPLPGVLVFLEKMNIKYRAQDSLSPQRGGTENQGKKGLTLVDILWLERGCGLLLRVRECRALGS